MHQMWQSKGGMDMKDFILSSLIMIGLITVWLIISCIIIIIFDLNTIRYFAYIGAVAIGILFSKISDKILETFKKECNERKHTLDSEG